MIKKMSTALFCSSVLLATATFATSYHLTKGVSTDYELPPGQLQTIKNHFPWKVTATCEVRAEENEKDEIIFQTLKNRIILNGEIIDEGKSSALALSRGDKFTLEFDSLSEAGLTNHGAHLVNIKCSV
ncbi:hypothetical protein ACFORL_12665 [Legionella dresdenensis]|uniref:Secreted protein n=1 Tax=Legionella dresdenensis TaxID=450200 RepID=A0ABV8CIU0_9GAMM